MLLFYGEESVRRLVLLRLLEQTWSLIRFDQDMEIPTVAFHATP